jgi:hypothetical protein
MDGVLAVGGDWPRGSGGWDWWALLGAIALFVLLETARRRPVLPLSISLSALGGLVLADLTDAWGVAPVWITLLLIALARGLGRSYGRSQV